MIYTTATIPQEQLCASLAVQEINRNIVYLTIVVQFSHERLAFSFLGDRLLNGSPYAIGPLSVLNVCLSVTLVYCSQTVGWIQKKLGKEEGGRPLSLGPGHIVLGGDPAPSQ